MDLASSDRPNFREGNSLFRNDRGGTAAGKNIAATLGIYGDTLVVEHVRLGRMRLLSSGAYFCTRLKTVV